MAKKLGKTTPVATKKSKPAPKPAARTAASLPSSRASGKPNRPTAPARTRAKAATVRPAASGKSPLSASSRTPAPAAKSVGNKSSAKSAAPTALKAGTVAAKPASKPVTAKSTSTKATPPKVVAKPAAPARIVKPAVDARAEVRAEVKAARPVVAVKPAPANGLSVAAKLTLKPAVVAALAAERSSPVMKLVKSSRPRPELVPVRLPPAPVRSDSKMARNRAGISPRELEHFRDLLFQKRRELTGDVSSMETSALHNGNGSLSTLPMHMADAGTDNYEQEFTLGLVEKDRKLLRDINVALAKIQDGSYGICEGTGKPISKPRLEAQPWAKYSIEHARALERPQFRRAF